tara:strand:+ start:320 stop:1147 length:828 start_codon:yes stop_codon:yes gene_type:complete
MSRGFVWFCLRNKKTDYVALSEQLGASIKKNNKHNNTCIITNDHMLQIPGAVKNVDDVVLLPKDFSINEQWKLSNEWQVFNLSPYTHTIKLEADELIVSNIDNWWNILMEKDLVLSYDCFNYKREVVKTNKYRKLFAENSLPNVYSGLSYFRKSLIAEKFYHVCKLLTLNWEFVKENILVNCHDSLPTTDVVYALASKIIDPLQLDKLDYEFFKLTHNKHNINKLHHSFDNDVYLHPKIIKDKVYVGGFRQTGVWHYHNKKLMEKKNDKVLGSLI